MAAPVPHFAFNTCPVHHSSLLHTGLPYSPTLQSQPTRFVPQFKANAHPVFLFWRISVWDRIYHPGACESTRPSERARTDDSGSTAVIWSAFGPSSGAYDRVTAQTAS